jgi:hypothetical protein
MEYRRERRVILFPSRQVVWSFWGAKIVYFCEHFIAREMQIKTALSAHALWMSRNEFSGRGRKISAKAGLQRSWRYKCRKSRYRCARWMLRQDRCVLAF